MSFKSQSTAKLLLVVLTATALTSGYFAKQWREQAVVAQANVATAAADERAAKKAYSSLRETLKPDDVTASLQDAVTSTVLDVFNQRVPNGVTVSTATPGRFTASGTAASLEQLADVVPKTHVQSVRLNVKGTYTTYRGFQNYLAALQTHPVSVVYLNVSNQGFDLGLRVYGPPAKS